MLDVTDRVSTLWGASWGLDFDGRFEADCNDASGVPAWTKLAKNVTTASRLKNARRAIVLPQPIIIRTGVGMT
jgi:hypothetical protein